MNNVSMTADSERVKRRYDTTRRRASADRTRRAILEAATALFIEQGYVATTMAAIAQRAGVNADTVYTTVGAKPALFRLLIETTLSGEDHAVPATNRDYVRDLQAEPDAVNKLAIYAAAISRIHARLGPLFGVLQTAAPSSPELAALWHMIAERRAANMRLLAADLATTGRLRSTVQEAADVIWATNSPEFYLLLVRDRQWTHEHYEQWLADSWCRLLLT
ncbi:transcriptional regulator, TetR family [Streptosporangium subroseum]|uniref:Transcriptional regulator, TetR family n=2 Tax=Streptosporangium subroseum TaxID=106412 RepID=A0A239B1P2_9ACTN|nr:transcriptional regulator, TetR family [Streptosporangium subroseum]